MMVRRLLTSDSALGFPNPPLLELKPIAPPQPISQFFTHC